MNKSLLLILLSCLFTETGVAQRGFQFKNHSGEEYQNVFTANFFLGGLGFGYAIGGEYERISGSDGKFSFHLLFAYSHSNDAFMQVAGAGDRYHYYNSFYIAPGVRFHPAGSFHRADFSLGLQLAAGPVSITEEHITGIFTETTKSSTVFVAPMVTLNVNFISMDGFVFGLYFGGGPVVAGDYGTATNGRPNTSLAFVQAGIKLGGNF